MKKRFCQVNGPFLTEFQSLRGGKVWAGQMDESIFRKKSLERIKSPENLDDYIQVSNPGVWLVLISIIVLLAGACVWGIFGHVDSTVPALIRVENGKPVCYIADEDILSVKVGQKVTFAEAEAVIEEIGEKTEEGYRCTLSTEVSVTDGIYEGKAVTESYKPLSFIMN